MFIEFIVKIVLELFKHSKDSESSTVFFMLTLSPYVYIVWLVLISWVT